MAIVRSPGQMRTEKTDFSPKVLKQLHLLRTKIKEEVGTFAVLTSNSRNHFNILQ